jgi:tetraacyldisaccharide 4'-kinase
VRIRLGKIGGSKKVILTTEKDAVRLEKFRTELQSLPCYVVPMRHRFLFDGEKGFLERVVGFLKGFARPE